MKVVRILFFVLLVPTFAFAQYKIVLKNGKVIEGKYLHEDQANIYVESSGIQMNFKKDQLDLDKMKELNTKVPAPEEISSPKPSARSTTSPKPSPKKAARVYTAEDLKQMKEIWDEGKEESEASPAEQASPVTQPEAAETAVAEQAPQTEAPTMPAENVQTAPVAVETQSQPAEAPAPPEPSEPPGPRDEKLIREEIETTKLQIAETEKRIQDLRAKGRVTGTWEKLVVKQKQRVVDLQQELKDTIAARKAAKQNS